MEPKFEIFERHKVSGLAYEEAVKQCKKPSRNNPYIKIWQQPLPLRFRKRTNPNSAGKQRGSGNHS